MNRIRCIVCHTPGLSVLEEDGPCRCWMTSEWLKTLRHRGPPDSEMQRHRDVPVLHVSDVEDTAARGAPRTCYTGMTWGGMRPSDDSMPYHYNIPEKLAVAKVLEYVMESRGTVEDRPLHAKASKLRKEMRAGVQKYGVRNGITAYEVAGCPADILFADDANIPSLLSLPSLSVISVSGLPYDAPRARSFYPLKTRWYTSGEVSGIGSPHTSGRRSPLAHGADYGGVGGHVNGLERVLRTA